MDKLVCATSEWYLCRYKRRTNTHLTPRPEQSYDWGTAMSLCSNPLCRPRHRRVYNRAHAYTHEQMYVNRPTTPAGTSNTYLDLQLNIMRRKSLLRLAAGTAGRSENISGVLYRACSSPFGFKENKSCVDQYANHGILKKRWCSRSAKWVNQKKCVNRTQTGRERYDAQGQGGEGLSLPMWHTLHQLNYCQTRMKKLL